MSPADALTAAMGRLYGPSGDEIRRGLPDHGDSIQAQLHELSARPSIERIDIVARNLDGLVQLLRRYRERLVAGEGDGQ